MTNFVYRAVPLFARPVLRFARDAARRVCKGRIPTAPPYPVFDTVHDDFTLPSGYGDAFLPARTFMVIAHRGARLDAPDNSIDAIRLAKEQGATVSEIDIRLSSDGHPIVRHDAFLNGATANSDPVSMKTRNELAAIGIPALEDVFRAQADFGYLLDILVVDRELIDRTVELIMKYDMQQRVLLIGKYSYLDQRRLWKMPRAAISDRLKPGDARGRALIDRSQRDGYIVYATVMSGDEERMRILIDLGVDGVMTPDIKTLARVAKVAGVIPS